MVNATTNFFNEFDNPLPTEEILDDSQIITFVREEINDNSVNDDSDREIPLVTNKEALNALKTWITFFEQQKDSKFELKDKYI